MYYEEKINYKEFKFSKKLSRLANFDDEVKLSSVKELLTGIKKDIQNKEKFEIEEYTKFYVNKYSFDTTKTIKYENLEETVERLNKIYFRFDYDKKDRPNIEEDKRIIQEVISTSGKDVRKDAYALGAFKEKIRYDLMTEDYNIKIFDFDGKNLNMLINNAKTWAWNCMHSENKKTIIIYRYNDADKKYNNEFQIILDIFKKANAKIYDMEAGIQLLQS